MSITATLSKKRHLAAASAAWLKTIPSDPEQPWPYATVEDYVQAALVRVAESWADSTGVDKLPMADFVLRFEPAEIAAIKAAASGGDQIAAGFIARLGTLTHVRLGGDESVAAFVYLVNVGLLTQERADAITAYDIPQPPE
jgi:hypothetical protein